MCAPLVIEIVPESCLTSEGWLQRYKVSDLGNI